MRNIENCVAWITGGVTGIGRAAAIELSKAGATVISPSNNRWYTLARSVRA
ncbi:hypothetical protein R0135_05930 [Congregibacter variabilis]|uniref:Short chain dehydrogenase n=1 Tax=Congregibacter variabilis TaxID=3081200 RepID=A0ABZ0I5A1_9GAMM|nr:hypothetical protein R0135_05930 [Congregibacter sp. IMCC43200]